MFLKKNQSLQILNSPKLDPKCQIGLVMGYPVSWLVGHGALEYLNWGKGLPNTYPQLPVQHSKKWQVPLSRMAGGFTPVCTI